MYLLADKSACTKVCPRSFISVNSLNAPLPQWDGVCSAIKCSEVMAGCEQCDTASSCTQVRLLLPNERERERERENEHSNAFKAETKEVWLYRGVCRKAFVQRVTEILTV